MKNQGEKRLNITAPEPKASKPFDLWKHIGAAKAHAVAKEPEKQVDSMLAVYKDRLTYTFIMDREVASIHYDKTKGEIFFKGHNLHNLYLSDEQVKALEELKSVLAKDKEGNSLLDDYNTTLDTLLADNNNEDGDRSIV